MVKRDKETPYSVTELTKIVKETLEKSLKTLWIKGEISNFSAPSSGHIYFTLKDESNQIKVAFFRGSNRAPGVKLEDGREVIIYGRVSIYGKRSEYQVIAEEISVVGAGDLLAQFEKLKKKLADEGLFDESRKKEIPRFPGKIGIITSPTGAAVRDILNILKRRYRAVEVLIYPALVQGEESPPQVMTGLKEFNKRDDIDVVILARGGGSIEDLWAFNDENLARAIYASQIPVISAVGHEIDFTIADFVSDLRAPTPSAAAELVVPEASEVISGLNSVKKRMLRSLVSAVSMYQERLAGYAKSYAFSVPFELYNDYSRRVDEASTDMKKALGILLEERDKKTDILKDKLNLLNPLNILKKGYSVVYDKNKKIVKDSRKVNKGDGINMKLYKGTIDAEVKKTNK